MGICTSCSSKGMLETELNCFFELMQIRTTPQEKIVTGFKGKWKGGLSLENWTLLVNSYLGKHFDGNDNDHYKQFWTDCYEGADIKYLLLAVLFLCEKHTVQMKQQFESLCKGIFKFKDQFLQGSNNYKTYIKKDFLKRVIVEYITLISTKCINLAAPFKTDNSPGRKNLIEVYSPKIIDEYASNILQQLEVDMKKKNVKVEYDEYTDFDEFFDNTYSNFLSHDKEVRSRLDDFGLKKLNEER